MEWIEKVRELPSLRPTMFHVLSLEENANWRDWSIFRTSFSIETPSLGLTPKVTTNRNVTCDLHSGMCVPNHQSCSIRIREFNVRTLNDIWYYFCKKSSDAFLLRNLMREKWRNYSLLFLRQCRVSRENSYCYNIPLDLWIQQLKNLFNWWLMVIEFSTITSKNLKMAKASII